MALATLYDFSNENMKVLVKCLFLNFIFLLIVSCNETISESINSSSLVKKIHIEMIQPKMDILSQENNLTRSAIYGSGSNFYVGFTNRDTIGIFPENGYQIAFKLNVPEGQMVASTSIIAEGWMTKKNKIYSCYLPFYYDNKQSNRIPWDLRKVQVENGNDSKDSMCNYAIYGSDTVRTTDTIFDTKVYYMGSAVAIHVAAPVTATYTKAVMALSKSDFASYGYFDLFDTSAPKESPTNITSTPYLHQPFHAEGYTDHISMKLLNFIVSSGTQMWFWFVVPETDAVGDDITVYVWDNKGNCYTSTRAVKSPFRRNHVSSLAFPDLTQTTTPYTNLNPWEEDKDTCSTCYPVAF